MSEQISEHEDGVDDVGSETTADTTEIGSLSKAAAGPPIDWDDAGSVAADARSDDPDFESADEPTDDPLKTIYGPPAGTEHTGD